MFYYSIFFKNSTSTIAPASSEGVISMIPASRWTYKTKNGRLQTNSWEISPSRYILDFYRTSDCREWSIGTTHAHHVFSGLFPKKIRVLMPLHDVEMMGVPQSN